MKKNQCKVTYLYNSGFTIETKNAFIIIDYYESLNPIDLEQYKDKNIYVLVSHNHGDHYTKRIYDWNEEYNVRYILHDDINAPKDINPDYVIEDKIYHIDKTLQVETFGSTDKGVSFLIYFDELILFHSGDLNWWKWNSDSKDAQHHEEVSYKKEIKKLIGNKINIAFVPVDPRLEDNYDLGVKYFANKINAQVIIPMHFRNSLSQLKALDKNWLKIDTFSRFQLITEKDESFFYDFNF